MAINKVSETTKKTIRENSVLALPDKPSEKGYSSQQLKEYFTNLVLGDVSSLTELDRVVQEVNTIIGGIEDTTIKNYVIDSIIAKFVEQAPYISLKFEDNKLKYTRYGNTSISGELDIIPENSVFFDNEQLKNKDNENIYPKTTLENIIGGIGNQSFKEYILDLKTKIDKIESNHEIDIKTIEDSLSQILGGDAPEALDSIKELAEALKNNPSSLDDILLQISNLRTGKVDVVAGKQLSTNDFDNNSKTFLDELRNKDVALKTDIKTSLSQLSQDSNHRTVTDDEKLYWNSKANEVHTHNINDVTGLPNALNNKSDVGHTHSPSDLGAEASGTASRLIGDHNQSNEAHSDIRQLINETKNKVDGMNNALTFENRQQLEDWFNGTYTRTDGKKPSDLYVGQYIYLKDQDEDDYWVSVIPATISNLSVLTTDKIDLTDYAEKDDLKRVAFTGSYTDLTDKPTIPTNLSDLKSDESHNTITNEKLQQIDINKSNIEAKLDKNLGASEANKMLITDSNGNVSTAQAGSMSILVDNLESDSTTMAPTANQVRILNNIKLDKQQGTENAGKHLVVNNSGLVDLVEQEACLPLTAGSTKPLTDDLYIASKKAIRLGDKAYLIGDDTDGRLTISPGKDRILTIRPNPDNSTGQMHIYGTVFRPGSKDGVQLGVDSAPWLSIYGTTIYQDGKQVANKEDIPDTSNLVTTDTEQTISGAKTFSANETIVNEQLTFSGNIKPSIKMTTQSPTAETATDFYLQSKNGLFGIGSTWNTSTRWSAEGDVMFTGDIAVVGEVEASSIQQNGVNVALVSDFLGKIYPIGSVYLSVADTSPASFLGGTWEKLSAGRALWIAGSGQGGTTLPAGLPNITGAFSIRSAGGSDLTYSASGAMSRASGASGYTPCSINGSAKNLETINFSASSSNAIYGKSTTVQPPCYRVYAWKRTA